MASPRSNRSGALPGLSRRAWLGWAATTAAAAGRVWAAAKSDEFELVATLVLRFAQFATWPEGTWSSAEAPCQIGVLGPDPFGGKLEQVFRGETVDGRPTVVRRFRDLEAARGCQLLFVGEVEAASVRRLLEDLRERPVLTLSSREGFCAAGGMVMFRVERGKMVFEINLDAVKRAKLNLHSRLLNVARIYREPAAP